MELDGSVTSAHLGPETGLEARERPRWEHPSLEKHALGGTQRWDVFVFLDYHFFNPANSLCSI